MRRLDRQQQPQAAKFPCIFPAKQGNATETSSPKTASTVLLPCWSRHIWVISAITHTPTHTPVAVVAGERVVGGSSQAKRKAPVRGPVGGAPHRHRHTNSACGRHRLGRVRGRLLARATASRHVDLQRTRCVISRLSRLDRWFKRHPALAGGRFARDPISLPWTALAGWRPTVREPQSRLLALSRRANCADECPF